MALTVEELFVEYRSYVATVAMRILGDPQGADDVVQETFISAHKHLSQLRDPGAARGWLARIAVRHAQAVLRKRKLKRFVGLDSVPDYFAIAPEASPEDRALIATLYSHLETLPANQRVVWTLRYLEGEKLEDVAQLAGCSLATAKRRIAAAQESIRQALEGSGD